MGTALQPFEFGRAIATMPDHLIAYILEITVGDMQSVLIEAGFYKNLASYASVFETS